MLLGVQGCGKSLAAKAVAGAWGVPLMRLDFGALYNKFLGETERNLREALKAADAMAPCVLWIDEMEKGVATNDTTADGGESRRVLGTLLTWMAERKSRVFIVATSNDIERAAARAGAQGPPRRDLLRRPARRRRARRDLPHPPAQARPGSRPSSRSTSSSDQTAGFSGAEIEQAVVAALYEANARQQALGDEHLLAEIARTQAALRRHGRAHRAPAGMGRGPHGDGGLTQPSRE